MPLHESTFEYLMPTASQLEIMSECRKAAAAYAAVLDRLLPEGPDKTFIMRAHRANAMWVNVAVMRLPDGSRRP